MYEIRFLASSLASFSLFPVRDVRKDFAGMTSPKKINQVTGWAMKIQSELFQPPSQRNSERNDTSFQSLNIELLESGKKLGVTLS